VALLQEEPARHVGRVRQVEADHEAGAARLEADDAEAAGQPVAALAHRVAEAVGRHHVEDGVGGRGDHRPARERRAVVTGAEHLGGRRIRHAGAHGQSAAQPLRDGHDVRRYSELLVRPERAGPTHAALDLVEDQQRAVGVAGLARALEDVRVDRVDPGLALDRLDQDGRGALAHGRRQRVAVVSRHDPEARHERGERRLLRLLGGRGQRPHRAAVEPALHHHELAAAPPLAGELQRTLDRLGAGVAQEDAPAERQGGQPLGEPHPRLGVEEVPHVHQPAGLLPHSLDHLRVAVAELGHRDPGEEVEVLVALVVPQPRALAAHELDRVARVRGHERLALECLQLR
jgi:hypothetical protein